MPIEAKTRQVIGFNDGHKHGKLSNDPLAQAIQMTGFRDLLFCLVAYAGSSLLATTLHAALPKDSRRAGGIAVVLIPTTVTSAQFQQQPVALVKHAGQRYAVVGLPLDLSVGTYSLSLYQQQALIEQRAIMVQDHPYKTQHLTIKDQSKVTPDAAQLERYGREATEQKTAYRVFSPALATDFPSFIKPTTGRYSSPFGFKRFFNGEPRAPHAGLDIAAPTGQTVVAPAAGRVIQTGDYFFNGQTVILDHGQGTMSMLCHLSRIDVKIGDSITQGQAIGLVGATGRATGAHLHWTLSLNDARVDPMLVLPK